MLHDNDEPDARRNANSAGVAVWSSTAFAARHPAETLDDLARAPREGSSGAEPIVEAWSIRSLLQSPPLSRLGRRVVIRSRTLRAGRQHTMVFTDSEESSFYSRCVKKFLLDAKSSSPTEITEFGSGDAATMARYLARSRYPGVIRGYEINGESHHRARKGIKEAGLSTRYIVKRADFFATRHDHRGALIVNPPYLPAPAPRLAMPELWGGPDGTRVVKRLIDVGFDRLMMLVASISDPIGVIKHARRRSYRVVDFSLITLPFGKYTLEPIVFHQIQRLASRGKALVRNADYQVAAVYFRKSVDGVPDRSQRLLDRMTCWCRRERAKV